MNTLASMKKRCVHDGTDSMKKMAAHMKKAALVVVLIAIVFPAVSPVSAQVGTLNGQQQVATPNGQLLLGSRGRQPAPSQAPTTGAFCIEENDRYVLQRACRSEHEWLRIRRRIRLDRRIRIDRRVRGKRRRGRQRVIASAVHARAGAERTLQLTGQTAQACGSDCGGFHFCHQFRQPSSKPLLGKSSPGPQRRACRAAGRRLPWTRCFVRGIIPPG
jgi:hypothetical protein